MADVFEQVVEVTEEYLGPTARRFITRQVLSHLGKQPEKLTAGDLPKLTEWTRLTLSLVTPDKRLVSEYADKMARIGGTGD